MRSERMGLDWTTTESGGGSVAGGCPHPATLVRQTKAAEDTGKVGRYPPPPARASLPRIHHYQNNASRFRRRARGRHGTANLLDMPSSVVIVEQRLIPAPKAVFVE